MAWIAEPRARGEVSMSKVEKDGDYFASGGALCGPVLGTLPGRYRGSGATLRAANTLVGGPNRCGAGLGCGGCLCPACHSWRIRRVE